MNASIAMTAAVLMLITIAYVSISVRVKQNTASKMTAEVENIERNVMKKVSPGMMDLPWKAVISFFK